jgi:hypothetical protein
VINLSDEQVLGLPVDQLGIAILRDLLATNEWNEYNYLLAAQRNYEGEALLAVAEAVAWLRARALVARTPGQTSDAAISVTRTGKRIAAEGLPSFRPANAFRAVFTRLWRLRHDPSSSLANTS